MKDLQLELDFDETETDAEKIHIERFIDIFAGTAIGQSVKDKYENLLSSKELLDSETYRQKMTELYEEVCDSMF